MCNWGVLCHYWKGQVKGTAGALHHRASQSTKAQFVCQRHLHQRQDERNQQGCVFWFHLCCARISLSWYTPDKSKGERVKLTDVWGPFDKEFAALSPEELAELKQQAEKEQHAKEHAPKQVKRAQEHDITSVIKNFQEAVSADCNLLHMVLIYTSSMVFIAALDTTEFALLSVVTVVHMPVLLLQKQEILASTSKILPTNLYCTCLMIWMCGVQVDLQVF